MGGKKISALTESTTVPSNSYTIIVDGTVNKKIKLETITKDLSDKVTDLENELSVNTNKVNEQKTTISNLSNRIDTQETTMGDLSNRVNTQGVTIGDLSNRVNGVSEQLDTITINVEKIGVTAEKIHNDFYNAKVIDLKNEKDFDINNISTCVNRVFSTIENYTTVKLNADLCYITAPINITMKEGCELILNCKIKCKADFNAININGNCVSNNVFIKSLESFDKVNFNTTLGCGLTLDNYYNSSIKIGEILGFNVGLLLNGTLGTQYNKIDFFSISNCKEPIKLLTTEEAQWINENTFTGGRLGGNVALTLNGLSGKDIINNNKFYNIGFEGVNELLIKSIGARYNSFFNPRVLENFPTSKWVDEDGTCIGNKYYFTFPVDVNMFKLDYLSQIIGTITKGDKTISQTGAICDWDITSEKMVIQYNYCLNGILMRDEDFNKGGGCITLSECFKEVYCKLSTSTRILRIDKHLLYNGFTFNLYVTSATSGSLKLEYYNKSGVLTTGTNFLGNGVYKVTMYNDLLVYTKIGDEFTMV